MEVLMAITLGVIVFTGVGATAVMERINNTGLSSLDSRYPNGSTLSGADLNLISNDPNNPGYAVSGETITITYPSGTTDASGELINPREIQVTAAWTDRGRPRTLSMSTMKRG